MDTKLFHTVSTDNGDTEFNYSYSTYDVFMIRSRIIPFIHTYLGTKYDVKFDTKKIGNISNLSIIPILGSKIVPLSEKMTKDLQDELNKVLMIKNNHSLIFSTVQILTDKNDKHIPKKWVEQIIRFIDVIPSKYSPTVHNYNIYADLSMEKSFDTVYEDLHEKIYEKILEFYHMGYITDAEAITDSWKLKRVHPDKVLEGNYSIQNLFKPSWFDSSFAPYPVDFLIERLSGNNLISIELDSNNVTRYYISKELNERKFSHYYQDRKIFIRCMNYDEAEGISKLCLNNSSVSNGKVLTLVSERLSYIKIYSYIASTFLKDFKGEYTTYLRKDIVPQIVFSTPVDMNIDLYTVSLEFEKRTRRVLLYIKNKYPDEIDIHKLIEKPTFKFTSN